MNTATLTRDPFMPRPPRVRGRALALAVLAHLLLVLGLWFSVDWRSDEPASVAAELWSATPQAAAPRAEEPPPTAQTEVRKTEPVEKPLPAPEAPPRPTPKPPEPVIAKPPTPTLPDPQIAIEKARREEAKRVAAEEVQKKERREKVEREKAERERQELALQKKKEADREKAEQARLDQARREKAKLEEAKAEKAAAEKAEKAEAARLEAIRTAQMKRMAGLAGATGGPADTGTALRSSAPSANYAGRVAARVKPNILFTDSVDGNPRAVVEVKLAPDGTIVAKRLVQSSGSKPWDDAVLRAIERTEILPLDNGRAPPVFEIGFRPRD